jgi:hypothetical protein
MVKIKYYGLESHFNENVTFYKDVNIQGNLNYDSLTVRNLTVSEQSTLGVTTSTSLSAQNLSVSGITTSTSLSAQNLSVSGITTSTSLSAQNLSVSGIITATTLKVNAIQNLNGVDITNNIIQVVTSKWDTTPNGYAYITSGSYTDSGASVSITPKISGSTMIITVNGRLGSSYGTYIDHNWQIRDNSGTVLPNYTNTLSYIERLQTGSGTSYLFMQLYDTNVTSAQTYKLYGAQGGGNGIFIFQPVVFTVMEVRV